MVFACPPFLKILLWKITLVTCLSVKSVLVQQKFQLNCKCNRNRWLHSSEMYSISRDSTQHSCCRMVVKKPCLDQVENLIRDMETAYSDKMNPRALDLSRWTRVWMEKQTGWSELLLHSSILQEAQLGTSLRNESNQSVSIRGAFKVKKATSWVSDARSARNSRKHNYSAQLPKAPRVCEG